MPFTDDELGHFISGFVTGEGCFYVTISKSLQVQCGFSVKVRDDDREMVELVREAMMYSGNIYEIKSHRYRYEWDHVNRRDSVMYAVRSVHELSAYVIPFFERYPLRGQKRRNFEVWREIVRMLERREHLTSMGLAKIVDLRQQLNAYQSTNDGEKTEKLIRELMEEYRV